LETGGAERYGAPLFFVNLMRRMRVMRVMRLAAFLVMIPIPFIFARGRGRRRFVWNAASLIIMPVPTLVRARFARRRLGRGMRRVAREAAAPVVPPELV